MKTKIEKRAFGEVRALEDEQGAPIIEGTAVLFNSVTELWPGMWEVVRPGAFKRTLNHGADIRGLFNHDVNLIWGRTKVGTATVWEDDEGLKYSGRINKNDPQAMSMHAKMIRGEIDQSSFAFDIPSEEGERFSDVEGGKLREIIEARLYDVSPVTYPQYKDSESLARVAFRNADPAEESEETAQGGEQEDASDGPAQESHSEDTESANQDEQENQSENQPSDDDLNYHSRLGDRLELEEGI